MRHTFYLTDHTLVVLHRATGYSPREGGGFQDEMSDFEQIGDGAVQTSVEDLLLWDRNFYVPIVGDAAVLQRAQTVGHLNNGRVLDYAAGLTIGEYRGLRTVRHGGAWAGYRADLLRFPDQKTSVACLCNLASANPSRLANQVADVVLGIALRPIEATKQPATTSASGKLQVAMPPEQLSQFAGVYRNTADAGNYRRLFVRDGRLTMAPGGSALTPVAADRFEARTGAAITFASAADGSREMRVVPAGGDSSKPVVFRQLPPVLRPDLSQYAGRYYSDELDATWLFAVEEGRLVVAIKGEAAQPLTIAAPGIFLQEEGVVVEFDRANGQVTGARVNAGRVRNLEFKREKTS
jgi:hypothetical protein